MDAADQTIYTACCVVLLLYILVTLSVFMRRTCVGCALSFVLSCALWLNLSLFNAWFFVPAFIYHVRRIDLHADDLLGLLPAILTSEAAQDLYLMILGSFGSWLAVFNAASMLSAEGCTAMSPHGHGKRARHIIKSVYKICDYLGFEDEDAATLPTKHVAGIDMKEKIIDLGSL
ncbi:hypothetical protein F4825DRAFT_42871 [Nemania diffusa]|nr:hypothetical protein F4825DRAFT_42871 [Nemania diffusa]